MSADRPTSEQRRGIHERGRLVGVKEGMSQAINQLAGYIGPHDVGRITVYALSVGMEAKDVSVNCRRRFAEVMWPALGIICLEDITIADDDMIARTQTVTEHGIELVSAIDLALPVFNLRRSPEA